MTSSEHEESFLGYLRMLAPDLPKPEREVTGLITGRKSRCDFVWRDSRVIVEIDGGQWKAGGGRHNTDEDREKINQLTLRGWHVLRYSGTMINNDPDKVISQVVQAVNSFRK